MPVTSAKTDFSYVGQAIHYAPKGQQFVQLNKNVNKTKSSQVGAVTASGGPSKHEYVNVCTCAARSIWVQCCRWSITRVKGCTAAAI